MTFANYLSSAAEEVEKELEKIITSWQERTISDYPDLKSFVDAFVDQCRGGKRVRGALVKLGYTLAGGKNPSDILPVSVAFEIFQTAILAHDDIIDRSELRRGKPSLYQALGGNHYGISQTISLGDLGFFIANELIAGSNFPSEPKNEALRYFSGIMQKTAFGEILDVYYPTQQSVTKENILTIIKLKTSPYTVIGPLSVGAILAQADEELLRKIYTYGENLGLAYQIHDDILGIFAEEKTLGKSNISDIIEGKRTLLFWYAEEHATPEQRAMLDATYGKKNITKDDVEHVQKIFKECGAYDYASSLVKTYTEAACRVIPEMTSNDDQQALLMDIARFLSERKK